MSKSLGAMLSSMSSALSSNVSSSTRRSSNASFQKTPSFSGSFNFQWGEHYKSKKVQKQKSFGFTVRGKIGGMK